jgi:hypothetical protein|tara:strand:+ start:7662 stop:8264 length:603 start_codon:yes stop_codon:yes gene_type:complete
MRARQLLAAGWVSGAVLLAGCGDPAPEARDAPSVASTPEPSAAPAAAAGDSGATLALEGDGLRVFVLPSGSARPIPFGTDPVQTLELLEAARGEPPSNLGQNPDCGEQFAEWSDGLLVWFDHEAFAGWSLADTAAPLSTVDGLKIGSTRAQLQSGGRVVEIAPSARGVAFTAGGVAGLLASDAPDAPVTHLWAGMACIAP